jgi:hypothetical protein
MLKQWQRECNVPLKSFQIERLAIAFLETWTNSCRDVFWYDWMVRDSFFRFMTWTNHNLVMPGTGENFALGSDWLSRAQTAYFHACKACDYERDNLDLLAGQAWQKIFGIAVPLSVS